MRARKKSQKFFFGNFREFFFGGSAANICGETNGELYAKIASGYDPQAQQAIKCLD